MHMTQTNQPRHQLKKKNANAHTVRDCCCISICSKEEGSWGRRKFVPWVAWWWKQRRPVRVSLPLNPSLEGIAGFMLEGNGQWVNLRRVFWTICLISVLLWYIDIFYPFKFISLNPTFQFILLFKKKKKVCLFYFGPLSFLSLPPSVMNWRDQISAPY